MHGIFNEMIKEKVIGQDVDSLPMGQDWGDSELHHFEMEDNARVHMKWPYYNTMI